MPRQAPFLALGSAKLFELMKCKKFLVQIEYDDETRFVEEEDTLRRLLAAHAEHCARKVTTGPEPRVTVTTEEQSAK